MIDNPIEVELLIKQIKKHLPLRAVMTDRLIKLLRKRSPSTVFPDECSIVDIHYTGDEGGIVCALSFDGCSSTEAFFASLTHLHFYRNMPLSMEISAYQKNRIRALKKANSYDPASMSIDEFIRRQA